MSNVQLTLHGESWIALETVAETFSCELSWVCDVYERGLLGLGERVGEALFVRTMVLERVAVIVRMHRHQGLELDLIEVLLPDDDEF